AREQRERRERADLAADAPELSPGQRVRLPGGALGAVVELKDGRALIQVGALRMELPAADLEPVEGASAQERGRARAGSRRVAAGAQSEAGWWSSPDAEVRAEVDLRGLRVEEVDLELGRALDAAVVGELAELRIIHGKGTGAVRARVQELLRSDRRVKEFRLGVHGEGGAGVTVARVS
ncbi:MAG: endonuclease MutS2, partial [Gemmatimonadetes bacterium]|nr:endonuclease MutS2 [Gemmatimonadota bacterium]